MVYGSWFFMFGLITTFIAIIVTTFWKFPLSTGPLLPYSNPVVLFFILIVYYWTAMCSMGFVSSLITERKDMPQES